LKDVLAISFRKLRASGESPYHCDTEKPLSDFNLEPDAGAKIESDAHCDFYLENTETGHIFYTDVTVTHPRFQDKGVYKTKDFALDAALQIKYNRYLKNYKSLTKEDVIPLVFDSYGGYASVTYKFLRQVMISISGNDFYLADRLFRNLRNRIAISLHSSQGELINYLNTRNAAKSRR
jgi:hypothetical protein